MGVGDNPDSHINGDSTLDAWMKSLTSAGRGELQMLQERTLVIVGWVVFFFRHLHSQLVSLLAHIQLVRSVLSKVGGVNLVVRVEVEKEFASKRSPRHLGRRYTATHARLLYYGVRLIKNYPLS